MVPPKEVFMSPEKIFGIVVRSFGLMVSFYSVWYLVYGAASVLGMQGVPPMYKTGYFLSGLLFLSVSLYLLRGAKELVAFCYPEETK
jgi:hypothetical protein